MKANVQRLIEQINTDTYPVRLAPSLRLIAVAEDDDFQDYDYDIVGVKARRFFHEKFAALGFKRQGSRKFIDPQSGIEIIFPKPQGILGAGPVDNINFELKANKSWVMATPTECLLAMFSDENSSDETIEKQEFLDFVSTHAVNFAKLHKWASHHLQYKRFHAWLPELRLAQEQGLKRRKLKRGLAGK